MGAEKLKGISERKDSASTFQEQLAQMKKELLGDGSLSPNDWSMAGNIDKLSKADPSREDYIKWKTSVHRWMKTFWEKLNHRIQIANNSGTYEENEDALIELKTRFEEIITIYKSLSTLGAEWNEGQKKVVVENLWWLKPKSDFRDIPLSGVQIAGIEPQRLLAKSSTCEYFLVAIPNAGLGIMRINVTDSSDEIALLSLNAEHDGEQLVQMIRGAEASGGFRDVEIDGSKWTWGDVVTQTTTWAGIWAGGWAIAGIGVLSAPGAVVWGVGWWLVGGIMGAFTDEDFTPADLDKFGLRQKFETVKKTPKS